MKKAITKPFEEERKMINRMKSAWSGILGGLTTLVVFFPGVALAEEAHGAAEKLNSLAALGCAVGLGIAVFGAALAQGKVAGSYMEGISRNPGAEPVMKTQFILGLAFVETLVIFTVGIVAWLVTKM